MQESYVIVVWACSLRETATPVPNQAPQDYSNLGQRPYIPYNTKHNTLLLTLALLMFWILTNNHYLTLTANKTTIFTNFANWTTNFHILSPEKKMCTNYLQSLGQRPYNRVWWRSLHTAPEYNTEYARRRAGLRQSHEKFNKSHILIRGVFGMSLGEAHAENIKLDSSPHLNSICHVLNFFFCLCIIKIGQKICNISNSIE